MFDHAPWLTSHGRALVELRFGGGQGRVGRKRCEIAGISPCRPSVSAVRVASNLTDAQTRPASQ